MSSRVPSLLIALFVALASAATGGSGTASADASQTPVVTGCPAGFQHITVVSLPNPPYRMPARIDAAGNNNGYICALALPMAVVDAYCRNHEPRACYLEQLGLPLYEFVDDNNPAQGAAAVLDDGN